MAALAHPCGEPRHGRRDTVDLRRVRLGHDAHVADHDAIVAEARADSCVKNRLPDCGATMSLRAVARDCSVTGAPPRRVRFDHGPSRPSHPRPESPRSWPPQSRVPTTTGGG